MKKYLLKKIAFLLSIVMVVSLFTNLDVAVLAEGEKVNVKAENYEYDSANDVYIYSVSSGNVYGTIEVPSDKYHLIIEDVEADIESVVLGAGATLEILGNGGKLKGGSTPVIQATVGAFMMLQSYANKPNEIAALYDTAGVIISDSEVWADWRTFRYELDENENGKWCEQQGFPDGNFLVDYDNRDGSVPVYCDFGGENSPIVLRPWVQYGFTDEEQQIKSLSFSFTQPEERQTSTPIVEIRVLGEKPQIYRSDSDSNETKINLVSSPNENRIGYSFDFTPATLSPLEVHIWWSEYDAFVGTDEKPVIVEIDKRNNGSIEVANVLTDDMFTFENLIKVRVAEAAASLELRWDENNIPMEIRVEGGDANSEDGWLTLNENNFNNNSCSIPLTQTKDFYYIQVQFDDGGNNPSESKYNFDRLQEELNKTYFAFGDINNSGTADTDDLKYGVMRTLYDGFRVKEGRYQSEGAALGLKEDFNKQDPANLNENMEKLLGLNISATQIPGDTITATDKGGTSHTFNAYEVTITINQLYVGRENNPDLSNFPGESEGATTLDTSIALTAKVYLIDMTDSSEQVIIKVKDTYFVRDAYSNRSGSENNEDDLEDFEGLNARALILVADYEKKEDIVVFGNYATMNETMSDETSDRFLASGFGTNGEMKYLGDKFVVMKPGFLGVTINGSGESKAPLAWSVESSLSIAETGVNSGNDTETDIYFGFDSVEIAPITSGKVTGLGVNSINKVEVLDGIPENAVQVVETAPGSGKYTVQFKSDYYDTVRIKVTYDTTSGIQSGIMTLNRVGIMIQGGMTAGDSGTVSIMHGHNSGETLDNTVYNAYKTANPNKTHGDYKYAYYATYYYPTDSNADSADTSLFVTYTYADGSVERKLIKSNYFTAATNSNVAMSDYILYMGDGSNAPEKVEAIAIPNVNPDGTINGAKLGAGKGVEGTFDIESE